MKHAKLTEQLTQYMDAGFPVLYLNTFEERLALEVLRRAAHNASRTSLVRWDMTHGYSIYSLRKEGGLGRKDMGRLMGKYVGESEEKKLICG